MASGKKNYFRHHFHARNDYLILSLIDKFDYKGYFFWFALIEICAEQCSEGMVKFCKFHESRLYRELRCNRRSLIPVLDYLASTSKLVYNYSEKFYQIRIVNLPKYMGKYQTKLPPNPPNKRKEKEIKVKEIKENRKGICPSGWVDSIVAMLNAELNSDYKPGTGTTVKAIEARYKAGHKSFDEYKSVVQLKAKEWDNDKMRKHLNPTTLFGNKFENYLEQTQNEMNDSLWESRFAKFLDGDF